MRKLTKAITCLAVVLVGGLVLTGCTCVPEGKASPAPRPKRVKLSDGCPVMSQTGDMISAMQAVPTGDVDSSVILLTKESPAEVAVGQSFEYTIKAENLTDCAVEDVVVTDTIPSTLTFEGSSPQARLSGSTAEWALGTIDGRDSKTIRVKVTPTQTGSHTHCANVRYTHKLCLTVNAIQPALALTKTMPSEVLVCDDIPVKLVVTNTGTGTAKGVTVTDTLPSGLTTVDGQSKATFDAGDLGEGESREFTFTAKAARTGQYTNPAQASAAGGLSADASAAVTVRQPVLTIAKSGPDSLFAGRPIKYNITVGNTGDTTAASLVVTDTLPAGTSFVSASQGGVESGGVVSWSAGSLAPNASKDFSVTVRADSMGRKVNKARAEAVCADPVTAQAATTVKGIPAILLEVIDIEDPIEVGSQETYIITATNQGSAPGTNIKIVCELEANETFVSAGGATAGSASGNTITFAPLPSLAPKAKAEWRVVVKAVEAGDVRFKVEMTSDQLTRPVNETESTHLY